jgi:hypothetical protein
MKGIWMTLFFIASLLFLAASVFMVLNRENTGASEAIGRVDKNERLISAVDAHLSVVRDDLSKQIQEIKSYLADQGPKMTADISKLKNKVEYLEMKAAAEARSPSKPINISLVYRKAQAKPKTVETLNSQPKLDEATLKKIKKKITEMSN